MPSSNPVIVVPGITATYLRDQYPLPPEIVWAVIGKDYRRVALHPDNVRLEAKEPARIVPDQLYEIAYEELIEELRYNLPDSRGRAGARLSVRLRLAPAARGDEDRNSPTSSRR